MKTSVQNEAKCHWDSALSIVKTFCTTFPIAAQEPLMTPGGSASRRVNLLEVSTSWLWWQAVAGRRGVQSSHAWRSHARRNVATPSGRAARPPHRPPPCAQPGAPMRECHGGRPRLPPRRGTAQAPHRTQGHPKGRTREEKRPNRFTFLVRRCPPASPLFASWPWPHHNSVLVGSS